MRLGHNLFDVAGAIVSSINTSESENVIRSKIKNFISEYEKLVGKIDLEKLNSYIQLWLVRGLLALINIKDIENINFATIKKYNKDIYFYKTLFVNFQLFQWNKT